jgi:hypothetical protein
VVPPATKVTVRGLNEIVRPAGIERDPRLTVPAKPFKLARVTVAFAEEPALKTIRVGLTVTLKSCTATGIVHVATRVLVNCVVGSVKV